MFSTTVTRKNQKDYAGILQDAAKRFVPAAGEALRAQAVLLAPWDSGNLRGSITWRTKGEDGGFNKGQHAANETGTMIEQPTDAYTVYIGTNVDYAEHVEYGTRNLPREWVKGFNGFKPYLRPAIDVMRNKLLAYFRRMVQEEASRKVPRG